MSFFFFFFNFKNVIDFLMNTDKQKMRKEKNYKERKNKTVTRGIMLVGDGGCQVS